MCARSNNAPVHSKIEGYHGVRRALGRAQSTQGPHHGSRDSSAMARQGEIRERGTSRKWNVEIWNVEPLKSTQRTERTLNYVVELWSTFDVQHFTLCAPDPRSTFKVQRSKPRMISGKLGYFRKLKISGSIQDDLTTFNIFLPEIARVCPKFSESSNVEP